MKNVLSIKVKNQQTSLPRVLRIISRQGLKVENLVMSLSMDEKYLDINAKLDCINIPEQLVRLLEKQIEVESVDSTAGLNSLVMAI